MVSGKVVLLRLSEWMMVGKRMILEQAKPSAVSNQHSAKPRAQRVTSALTAKTKAFSLLGHPPWLNAKN
jgi:hypothetical protein